MIDDKSIRKALESPLKVAMAAATPAILVDWENQGFDPNQTHPVLNTPITEYVRASYHPNPPRAMTIGETPREQIDGFFRVDVFVQQGTWQDRADDIADLVKAAYPITTNFTRNGIQVQIGTIARNSAIPWLNWWYIPLNINFTCWSAS